MDALKKKSSSSQLQTQSRFRALQPASNSVENCGTGVTPHTIIYTNDSGQRLIQHA